MQILIMKGGNFLIINTYYKNNNARIYQCDNLELLKQLPDDYIDLIYCDILYNTGKKFKDYNDNLGTPQEAVEWYIPRLIEMKRVLKDIGSIYLHMDYRLVHYLKIEMDKIFGIENFKNEIIWCYNIGGKGSNQWAKKHDNILFYTKSNKWTFNGNDVGIIRETGTKSKGGKIGIDENNRPYQDKKVKDKYYRYYLDTNKIPEDWWSDINSIQSQSKERTGYDTQKPKILLERIIKASSNEGDIVADFFMGSGTTGEVALELGRKFIGCDIGERACEITKERLEKTIQSY